MSISASELQDGFSIAEYGGDGICYRWTGTARLRTGMPELEVGAALDAFSSISAVLLAGYMVPLQTNAARVLCSESFRSVWDPRVEGCMADSFLVRVR